MLPPLGLFLRESFVSNMKWKSKVWRTKYGVKYGVKYGEQIIQIERGSFCPLIFSMSVGVGPSCDNLHKKLAGRIVTKRKEIYGDVIRFIRTHLRYALLKCVLMGLRGLNKGYRGIL